MKIFTRNPLAPCLLGCLLALTTQAGTVTDNFNAPLNYLTNGVKGTIWDGVYFGSAGEFPGRTGIGTLQSTVQNFNASITSNGVLVLTATHTDWENAADDGVFLFKTVSGDFDMSVQIIPPLDAGNFNTWGLHARVFGPGGAPIQPTNGVVTENYISYARFPGANGNRNYSDNVRNGADAELSYAPNANTNYFLRMERVGTDFNLYEKAVAADPWALVGTISRPDFAGAPMQVGLMQAGFGGGVSVTARMDDFSLTAAGVGGTAPSPVTGLTITTNAQNNINISWTAGAGSDGTLVDVYTGTTNLLKQAPGDGTTYTGNANFGQGDRLPSANHFVAFSGNTTSMTLSNLAGAQTYHVAVYSFAGAGAARTYNRSPLTASVVSPATPTSVVLAAPSSAVAGSARKMAVTAFYNNGATFDVTATATYASSASNVVTIQAAGRYAALTNGTADVRATFSGLSSTQTVSVVSMARTHRWSFSEAGGATTFVDSDAGANGTLQNSSGLSGATGSQVSLSGTAGDYVTLPPNLLSNYGALTLEAWATDVGAVAGARIAAFFSDATHITYMSSLSGGGPRGAVNDGTGLQSIIGAVVTPGSEHHYVFTVQGASRAARMYVDGLLVAQSAAFTLTPEDAGATANDWIGRSEAEAYFNGGISELRTYNGALDPLAVAINTVAGPDTLISNPGALQSLTLTLNPTTMTEGDTQLVNTIGNFQNISHVDITTVASYTSSSPLVATVSATGVLTARSGGTTTISAIYSGQTNSAVLTVLAKPPGLKHRYSFNEAAGSTIAVDSIAPGVGDASVLGTAVITNGQVVFDGVNANAGYVNLAANLFADYNSTTIEAWVTDDNSGTWSRVWDFGNGTVNYIFLTFNPAATLNARTAIRNTTIGEQVVNFRRPAIGKEHHVVYSQDWQSQTARVYMDGVLVATNTGVTLRPRDMVGQTALMWLGRSQFGDNYFKGSINELRIWEGANTPAQVALSYGLGPNSFTTLTNPGTVSTVSVTISAAAAGQVQQAKAMVNFASLANVNMAPSASNWVSSDVTVAKVDQTGVVTAVGAGNATISATFSGVTGNGALTVSAGSLPVLAHRYSFTNNANDSITGSNGTLAAGATINNGTVVLTGAADSQVNLPGHLFDGFSSVSFETWATFTNSTPNNASLWGFGNPSPDPRTWLAFIPQGNAAGDTRIRYFLNQTNSAAAGEVTLAKRGRPVGAGTGTTNVHYVVVINSALGQAEIYINGTFQEAFSWTRPDRGNILPIDLSRLSNEQGFLGHTVQTNGTPAANAITTIDEFRIWNGALNRAQIASSYAAGPNNPVIDPGVPSAISLKLSDPTAVVGTTQRPSVRGTFTSGTFDLTGISGVGLSSDNTAIMQVDGDRLRAVAAGTANITARYGGKTDTKPVTVIAKQFVMTHQYSFTADAADSKGGADGALWGSAIISNGAVVLNASTTPLTFVELPSDLISGYGAVSLEMFGTITANVANNRLFDFGDSANGTGVGYLSLDPNASRVFTLAPNPVRNGTLAGAGVAEQSANVPQRSGTFHVVAVVDDTNPAAKTIRYYTNGVLAVSVNNDLVNLSTLNNVWSFLGRSMWVGDPLFNGSINEFRVYYGAMSAADVTASFTAGPDTVPSVAPKLNVSQSGSSIVLSWSDATFSLVAAGAADAAAGTYTNVPGATSPYTTAPSQLQLYYRLKK